jgi:uncharacterized peroxidase-related enzyme
MSFLSEPETTAEAQRLFDEDIAELGFVMNASRLWAYQPDTLAALFGVLRQSIAEHKLTLRERGIVITACTSAFGDSYCSLAWGSKLAEAADADTAAAVLRGVDGELTTAERAMADWARKVARDPNRTTAADVQQLRDAGIGDAQIFAITTLVALRLAFSTVNDALGAHPDAEFRSTAPEAVLESVTFGRPIA